MLYKLGLSKTKLSFAYAVATYNLVLTYSRTCLDVVFFLVENYCGSDRLVESDQLVGSDRLDGRLDNWHEWSVFKSIGIWAVILHEWRY